MEFDDEIGIIEKYAFVYCSSLRSVKFLGVKIIQACAFTCCTALKHVDFGDKLERIEKSAFFYCRSLRTVKMPPSIRTIECNAFGDCEQLTDLELPEDLETLEGSTFKNCRSLRRSLFLAVGVFYGCIKLATIDLVGGIHNTVASLHLESWRNEVTDEISRINQVLPNKESNSITPEVQQWMR